MKHLFKILPFLVLSALWTAGANVLPNQLFSDNAVLQRGINVPVWGNAVDGEKVTVEFAGQKHESITKNGHWSVSLQPLEASSIPRTMTITGSNTVTLTNILVGEV